MFCWDVKPLLYERGFWLDNHANYSTEPIVSETSCVGRLNFADGRKVLITDNTLFRKGYLYCHFPSRDNVGNLSS